MAGDDMTELEKLQVERIELNFQLDIATSFVAVMALTAQLKALDARIEIEVKKLPPVEPPLYVPGGRATEMSRTKRDVSSRNASGHDPLKVLFGK
jgi:hypothetical protein